MEEIVDLSCGIVIHGRASDQIIKARHTYVVNVSEPFHKCLLPYFTDSLYFIKKRLYLILITQRTMIGYGKSVDLILYSREKLKCLTVLADGQLLIFVKQRPGPVTVILHHTADLYSAYGKLLQHLLADIDLSPASVHTYKIREIRKRAQLIVLPGRSIILHLIESMLETAGKHLIHGGIIIRPLHRLDTELSVIVVLGLSVLIYHHGTDIQRSHGIGNIIGLDTERRFLETDNLLKLLYGLCTFRILLTVLLSVAVHEDSGIGHGKLHQLLLLSYLRCDNAYLFALLATQPLLKYILIRELGLHPELVRDKGSSVIILLYEIIQDDIVAVFLVNVYKLVVSADYLAVPDKEDLDYAVGKFSAHTDDIPVSGIVGNYLLSVLNRLYGFDEISHLYSCFKVKIIGSSHHLPVQLFYDVIILSVQKIHGFIHLDPVIRPALFSETGGIALMNVIIHALVRKRRILGKYLVAVPDMEGPPYEVDNLVHLIVGGIGSEVLSLVSGSLSHLQHPRILFHGHLDIGIGLIILQKSIVSGFMLLYEIVLKHQGFKLRIHNYIFEPLNQTDHLLDLYGFFIGFLKILLNTVFQHLGLSHIDYLILRAMHQVHSRKCRQFFQFFIKVEFTVISH